MIQKLQFEKVICYIDLEKDIIYSARKRILKPFHSLKDYCDYYYIHYNGFRVVKSYKRLKEMAKNKEEIKDEIL